MYNRYVTISESIFRDLLTARSKVRDLEIWVDGHQNFLARVQVLGPLRHILQSTRYDEDMFDRIANTAEEENA